MEFQSDPFTVTIPRSLLIGLSGVSASFTERTHELLEKNTEGTISRAERRELESLVGIAQVDQIVTLALQLSNKRD